ncbi:hypothetical protein [Synechococcus sp. BL107]|uniref:hypothetical protein n=1 Tax=Synechococcus sp. BL107 TaxID=313625 RepID=UPI0002F7CBCE|nr:hypothetical protein [Synechococcus sp. BL107]
MPPLIVCTETVAPVARHGVVSRISARAVSVLITLMCSGLDVNAQGFEGLESDSIQCLQTGNRSICQRALDKAEVLQRLASTRQAYPCQTMLLGVQADLILQQLGDGRGDLAISDLEAARRGCPGL